jgi:siroheme synthase
MGLARLEQIVAKLLEHGAAATLPAAIVAQGTLANQRVIAATLGSILDACTAAALESPALLVVGEVVALQSTLAWFTERNQADVSRSA